MTNPINPIEKREFKNIPSEVITKLLMVSRRLAESSELSEVLSTVIDALRDLLNDVITAPDVVAIAADQGFSFQASTLLGLFERCNEAPLARQGLMDEKLIRVYLQRQRLQAP